MPSIALAVMVKNDAERLDRCLESASRAVDSVIVLDTGSTDGSVDIATKHGAQVERIEWPGDFSAALNTLLGFVKADWTLRLDADEWLEPNQGLAIRSLAQDEDVAGFRLVRRDLDANKSYAEVHVMRLWRTHEKLRYTGVVHETISAEAFVEAWPGLAVASTGVWLWHDGYIDGHQAKFERNVALLREELQRHPERINVQAMLATTLRAMEDPAWVEAIQTLCDQFLASDNPALSSSHVAMGVAMGLEATSPDERGLRLAEKALKTFPKTPAILYFAALVQKERGDFAGALKTLLKLEARAELGDYDRNMAVPRELLEHRLWNALGFVASQLGRADILDRVQRKLWMAQRP